MKTAVHRWRGVRANGGVKALCFMSGMLFRCGAANTPAPFVPSAASAAQCERASDKLKSDLLGFLHDGGFAGIAAVVRDDLVPSGVFSDALIVGIKLLKKAPARAG